MRDWKTDLRLSAEAVDLAGSIYHHRMKVYGRIPIAFADLPPSARRPFIEIATSLLQALDPAVDPLVAAQSLRSRDVLRLVK